MDLNYLPQLVVVGPSRIFEDNEVQFTTKFNILKAYESPLSIETFCRNHARSAKALLSCGTIPITQELLDHLPSLQIIATDCTGVNHIDLVACRERGITVTNTGGVLSEDTADFAIGLLLDVLRKISAGDAYVRRGLSRPLMGDDPLCSKLGSKQVGILGLGNIGSKVAKRLTGFGCNIAYSSRTKKMKVPYSYYETVHELASHCNVLVICCSLTQQTRHMVNDDVLAALGKDGIIINVARGAIVDEKSLVKHLMKGEIGGAGLDVFENEPSVPMELLQLDNVILTPHRAAFTQEAMCDSFDVVTGNLEAFFSNKPLISQVMLD